VNAGIYPPSSQSVAMPLGLGGAPVSPAPTPGRIDGVLDWRRDLRTQWPSMRESMLATIRGNTFVWRKYTSRATFPTGSSVSQGCLMVDGRVYMPAQAGTSARIYDPWNDSVSTPAGTFPGSSAHIGAVLLPDGRIYIPPLTGTTARIYDPATNSLSTPAGTFPGSFGHFGGCVMADGRVYIPPGGNPGVNAPASTARIYDPRTDALSIPAGTYRTDISYRGSQLLPSGDILIVPFSSSSTAPLYIYRPQSDSLVTSSQTLSPGSATSYYYGSVLMADERVFLVPYITTGAYIYDWRTDKLSVPAGTYTGTASGAHIGGALLPDGTIGMAPAFSTAVRNYNPITDTLSNPDPATTFTGSNDYNFCCVLDDGRLFMMPRAVANPVIYGVAGSRTFSGNITRSSYWNHK